MASPSDPESPTGKLCTWISQVTLEDVPENVKTRAKYLILDGLGCALVGAHLPWSEKAAEAVLDMEASGSASIFGWEKKISPVAAALINSTFIQGFELDDWHSDAPLHSNSIVLPALLAAAEYITSSNIEAKFTGNDLLLATLVGYEVGPRVGLGLHGAHMLTMGWHSGAVFGPSAAAASVSKLLGLSAGAAEDALGIACTQACGLMSAQFESEVKRMQHGFAARNGLFAALLARKGYVGIKKVYERSYGGFLTMFGLGNGKDPRYLEDEIAKGLGTRWQTEGVRVKPHAAMAGTHGTADCIKALQEEHSELMKDFGNITDIQIDLCEAAFHHGGWKAEKPLTETGAQMSNSFVGALQIVDGQVLPLQFRTANLDKNDLWNLVGKTTCTLQPDFPRFSTRVTITFSTGQSIQSQRRSPRGIDPPLTNEEILAKWRYLTENVIDAERRSDIEKLVLNLESCDNLAKLCSLMARTTKNPIA